MQIFSHLVKCIRSSLRYKLLTLVLLPILLITPTVIGLAVYWSVTFSYNQLFLKVNTDLNVSHDVFQRLQRDQLANLEVTAASFYFREILETGDAEQLRDEITRLTSFYDFDYLNLLLPTGERYFAVDVPVKQSPLLAAAVETGLPGVGIELFSNAEVSRENQALADSIRLSLVDTPRAVPTDRSVEDRAMLIRSVYPVSSRDGEVIALIEGGVLLNRNFDFVDAIRDLVYGRGSLAKGSLGTVTVFLEDVRVSTNVPTTTDTRALGTRVSREVRNTVLEQGDIWVDRAFVVNDWYISAYEPIVDVYGNRVGMLYAGFLETPFRQSLINAIVALVAVLLLGAIVAAFAAIRGAKSIFKPIEAMAKVVRATQSGEAQRIGKLDSSDEIGELARQVDSMLDSLEENRQRIQHAADVLESKVEERTAQLQQKNIRLQRIIDLLRKTRQRLAMAEKLAALGELTAGVAHEINNPTAVILGNMDVLVSELGEDGDRVKVESDLIVEQVYRIRSIVDRLLQYSRPSDYAGYVEQLDVVEVIQDTLNLVKHELEHKNAEIVQNYVASDEIMMNRQELQQVLVNLLINAAHAIDKGGKITISTADWSRRGVVIIIRDNGRGMSDDELRRVFDPFYTTNKTGGTGLGLSVSYGLIRRYGGEIVADSLVGHGAEFRVHLRKEPIFTDDEEELLASNEEAV